MIYCNWEGVRHAQDLIAHGKISHRAFEFSDDDERELLGPEGTDLANHSRHHLGTDDELPQASPKRNRYPFAKRGMVYSRALHGIRNAAHDAGHEDIRDLASKLLGDIKLKHDPSERAEDPAGERRHIVKDGGKYLLYSKDGHKLLSKHDSKEGALAEEAAIKAREAAEPSGRLHVPGREVRSIRAEVKVRETEAGPAIHGYGIVYDRDSHVLTGDDDKPFVERIHPRALEKLLASGPDVRALGNHDPNMLLGRTKTGTLTLRSDDVGVHYEIKPPKSAIGDYFLEVIRRGDMDGSSFGFNVAPGGDRWDMATDPPTRTVTEIRDLFDIGPATFPAYQDTTVAARALRSLERARPRESRSHLRRQRLRALSLIFPYLKG